MTATTSATLSTLSNVLKDFYLPPLTEQLNSEILLLQRLEPRDQELFGNQAVVPLHITRSAGIGPAPENGALPSAGAQGYDKAVFDLKYLYGRVRVTGPSMAKTASEAGAFLKVLQSELDGIRIDLKKDLARQVYMDGTALIAKCGSTTSDTVVVLDSSAAEAIRKGWLHIGMRVDIGTTTDGDTVTSGATISDVDVSTPSITIDASVSTTSSNYVRRSGSTATAAYTAGDSYEIDGLAKLVSTSANTVGGIDSTASGKSYWQNIADSTGGTVSQDAIIQMKNRIRIAGGEVSLMIGSFGLQRALYNTFTTNTRYVNTTDFKGGFSALDVQGSPFVADVDAPFGKIYLLDEKHLRVFSPRDWHFLDEDGNILKWVVGYDAWEAVLARYINLGIVRRNVQGVMTGLTDTTGY